MSNISPLRGFRVFGPDEMAARRKVFETLRKIVESYGFKEVDVPSVEPLDIFRLKSGSELVEQTFSFRDKGGREVTLIPESTPAFARMIATKKKLMMPVRLYSIAKHWRYEEPQAGRMREFYQLNLDIFGVPGVEAEAELIALSVNMLRALGLKKEFIIKISDRRLLQTVVKSFGIKDIDAAYRVLDKRGKISAADWNSQLCALGLNEQQIAQLDGVLNANGILREQVKRLAALLPNTAARRVSELQYLAELIEYYGVSEYCYLDLSIVRGIAYYTGIVFECHDVAGELRAMFGGGRYDNLVELLDGEPTPAVGLAVGDAVLELLCRRAKLWPEDKPRLDYFVLISDKKFEGIGIKIAEALRRRGHIAEYDLLFRPFSKQLKYADRLGAKKVIIVAEEELKNNEVAVKDMETGMQEKKMLSEFLA